MLSLVKAVSAYIDWKQYQAAYPTDKSSICDLFYNGIVAPFPI
jgi:hypothetical protein